MAGRTAHARGRLLLTGAWRNLCFVNYAVAPAQLARHLPPGLTLDTVEGEAFVSVVALDFLRLRLLGVPGLGCRRFPQVSFRFYVRDGERRGVVFLRELVPSRLLALASRGLAGEPCSYAPLHSEPRRQGETVSLAHQLGDDERRNRFQVCATAAMRDPRDVLPERFFTERHWSYNLSCRGRLRRYEVLHPLWAIYRVEALDFVWDFASIYGSEWAWLSHAKPHSVIAAEGSAIRVFLRS